MKRTAKKIIVAATIAAVSLQSASTASACGGRGGRPSAPAIYGGYARAAANYRTTLPATPPIYSAAPTCSQPTYNQPLYGQPGHAPSAQYPSTARPIHTPQPVASVQPRPRAQVAAQTAAVQNAAAPINHGVQQTMTPQAATQLAATQTPAPQSATTNDAETSALAALASIANAGSVSVAATPQQATPVAASTPSVPAAAGHVGVFTATLPSNVTIELRLDSGNTFSWIVRNNGKTSQFSGQYRIAEGRLILVRSNDLQKMAGSLTTIQNGFTFKLDGTNTGGLDFKKV